MLRVEDVGRVRLLTLDRPEALNAFNDDLYDAVCRALADASASPDVAVVVVTGQGRAFSAGQDLAELDRPRRHEDGSRHGFAPFIEMLEAFPKPLVAAVNGIGVGIGLTLLPHCDLVLIADEARLRAPFVSLGVTAEAGSTHLLPETIGWQQTAHLLYTASWIDAAQAVESGLAWRSCPGERLLEEAMEVAAEIASMPIASLVGTKKLLQGARLDAVRAARARENVTFEKLARGPANREAIAAFREKRKPDFSRLPPDDS
ncbi:MAG: enoyl-CoA hydratase/isomerase family protein [bacterium]|nr:enoyl-CoA hydratase/isomerase family protein [bacterium]MCP5069378.1 enoyl-CoA hydratase/isomerase family protein [bacterium]